MSAPLTNALTVDVEDYFQVSALAEQVKRDQWDHQASRVEGNTMAVLQLLDDHGTHGTFFTLGWIAQRHPHLIRTIVDAGHELASHGLEHRRVGDQTPDQFRDDVSDTKRLLEDISGIDVKGYRAASFSISRETDWAFEILAEAGYHYSSSIYPIHHDHYGMPDAPRFPHRVNDDPNFWELPVSTISIFGQRLPCGGGGYFRLLPYQLSKWAISRLNAREGQPCMFYFHPWEIDDGQPRIAGLSARSRFRHYTNLSRIKDRLRSMLRDFAWDRVDRVFLGDHGRG